MPPGRPAKPPAQPKANPLRNRKPIVAPVPLHQQRLAAAAAAKAAQRPARRACPNKECSAPDVQDGVCHNCGTIVDDSNIVSEVQFGESSNGAAVVQGSFVSADQGTAKSLGPAFRRAGGMEDREKTVREGRQYMNSYAGQLQIPDTTVTSGLQIFKLAAANNFIQGRRMDMVAAVCLYSACRKEKPCRVMLIDFADKVQVNVFKLGRTFKALHRVITLSKDGINPVLPEDLIYRFASKLEFGTMMQKVAEDAVRMVKRMSLDWMVMGRRPSGVCGACLILAARMNNFRRTITEVVYIVKVTTHTIQKRLEEFKVTPSSALTVEDFLNNEFLESAHDPPSFYQKTEEYQKNKKKRKRRSDYPDESESREGTQEPDAQGDGDQANKRQRTAEPDSDQPVQSVELRRDADGFAIPPQPTQSDDRNIDPDLVDQVIANQTDIYKLVAEFGDSTPNPEDEDDAASTGSAPTEKRTKTNRLINVPTEWDNDEHSLENEISEMISDPNSIHHAASYAQARRRAAAHMLLADQENPSRNISMDVLVGEDEFADDIEVQNCVLPPDEVAKKEQLWVNHNKDWLRKQQIKEWAKKNAPKKNTRNREKKPRIGEGQTSAASTPAEAAIAVMKERSWSKKINYDALNFMLTTGIENLKEALGSAGTSRVTSRAGSEVSESRDGSVPPSPGEAATLSFIKGPNPRDARYRGYGRPKPKEKAKASTSTSTNPKQSSAVEEDDEGEDSDYISPSPAPVPQDPETEEDWRRRPGEVEGEDELPEDEEEYEDYGDLEAGGIPDDIEEHFGGMDDMDEDYEAYDE